jgi:hypothetical protein
MNASNDIPKAAAHIAEGDTRRRATSKQSPGRFRVRSPRWETVGDGVDSVADGCGDPVDAGLLPVLLMVPVGVGWPLGEPPLVPPSNRLVPVAGRPRSRSDSGLPAASSTTVTVTRMPTKSKTVTATSIRVRP